MIPTSDVMYTNISLKKGHIRIYRWTCKNRIETVGLHGNHTSISTMINTTGSETLLQNYNLYEQHIYTKNMLIVK